jgi:uncharacterized protein with ParB-like and HNH nuclease domain
MKITCLDKSVGKLLAESFYRIPRFQRPYSWDRVNVEDFWNDAIVENEGQYFIGNFVVYDDKTAMGIVDGQQRLTTITLLLCALRNAFNEEGFPNLAKGIHNLIERPDISDQLLYVLQTQTSYPYFQEHIQKFGEMPESDDEAGPEEQLMKQAFDFFVSNIDEIITSIESLPNLSAEKKKARVKEDLSKIRDKILSLNLIYTALENDDDAYVIFETLNTRGKDLMLSDLVKSHLVRLLKPTNKGVDITKDKWDKTSQMLEQADLDTSTFILHFWLSRYEYTTEKKLYKALKARIKKDSAKAFLNDLVSESEIYRYIHDPNYRKWKKEEAEIRNSLIAMNHFRIKQQLPMVLSVMQQYESGLIKVKHVRGILEAIENFHFAFTAIASQRSSGGISFMYALAGRDLYNAKDLTSKASCLTEFRKTKLAPKRPSYAEFEPGFLELKFSTQYPKQRNLVRYVLLKIYQAKSIGLPIDPEQATIEHLVPQSAAKSANLSHESVASIGNLILVDKKLNEKLADKDFAEKVKILNAAKVWVDPVILKAKTWGAAEIEQRSKLLAEAAYKSVWAL